MIEIDIELVSDRAEGRSLAVVMNPQQIGPYPVIKQAKITAKLLQTRNAEAFTTNLNTLCVYY